MMENLLLDLKPTKTYFEELILLVQIGEEIPILALPHPRHTV